MTGALLENIGSWLNSQNPNVFSTYFTGARRYDDSGRVMIETSDGDYKYVGLQDSKHNFFYIRYLDNMELRNPSDDERVTACGDTVTEFSARLVVWIYEGLQEVVLKALLSDLTFYSVSTLPGYSHISLEPVGAILDYPIIYEEEIDKEELKGIKGVMLLAIDFRLSFHYLAQEEECIDREFCKVC